MGGEEERKGERREEERKGERRDRNVIMVCI